MDQQDLSLENIVETYLTQAEVVGFVHLHRLDWRSVYQKLYQLKDHVFTNNQRLVVLYYDTDYHASVDTVGNALYNFFKIVSYLDISTDHMIVVCDKLGVEPHVQELCGNFNISVPQVAELSARLGPYPVPRLLPTQQPMTYLYSCLNAAPRSHRKTMVSLLHQHNLMDLGMVSHYSAYNSLNSVLVNELSNDINYPDNLGLRITLPHSSYNDELSLCRDSVQLHVKFAKELGKTILSNEVEGVPNESNTRWVAHFLEKSFVYVVTETVGNYPYFWFSEKTWRAIVSRRPFMLVGPQYNLKKLQTLGFKTFSDFWDESYDQFVSAYDRCVGVVRSLESVKDSDWAMLLDQMQPVLDHNVQCLESLINNEIKKIQSLK